MMLEGQRSIAEVVRDALSHVQEILRSEIRLAKAEVREEASKAKNGAMLLAIGGVCALFAVGFLLLAAVYVLTLYMPAWGAALIVGGVVGIAALIFLMMGRNLMRKFRVMPQRTVRTVKEDVAWARHHAGQHPAS